MVQLTLKTREGAHHVIDVRSDMTLMESIRHAGIDEIMAMCGGCCSCATCHVYIDGDTANTLSPAGRDERDLLESSDHGRPTSRLSCQVKGDELRSDMIVSIAPED